MIILGLLIIYIKILNNVTYTNIFYYFVYRSELITSLDHEVEKATNNAIEQCNNNDEDITQQKINENKNERISNKEEKSEISNNEDDTYEKKMDIKLKEIGKQC